MGTFVQNVYPGGSITVTLYLPKGTSPQVYYKYGPTPDDLTDHWYEFVYDGETGAKIHGNVITLYFVDGRRGDDDLDGTNGIVVDQAGLGFTSTGAGGGGGGGGCFIDSVHNQKASHVILVLILTVALGMGRYRCYAGKNK